MPNQAKKMKPLFDRSIALVQDYSDEQLQWMFVEEQDEGTLSLPWADRLERESYRECLSRELDWNLSLDRKRDYVVCATPRISLIVDADCREVISRDVAKESGFGVLEVYPIQLFGKRSRAQLRDDHRVRFYNATRDALRAIEDSADADWSQQTRLLLHWLQR